MVDGGHQTTRGVVRRGTSVLVVLLGVTWAAAILTGLFWLTAYDFTPGPGMHPPARWPSRANLPRAAYTLVMAAHPKCPCTNASIDELSRLMASGDHRLTADVLFYVPPGVGADWWGTALWAKAAAIPGVTVHLDRGGEVERLFGAITSGSVIVYDAEDRLRFHGGITAARGHVGDNAGRSSLIALLETGQVADAETPVFGCPLRGPTLAADASPREAARP
jgi:hypothetical protein